MNKFSDVCILFILFCVFHINIYINSYRFVYLPSLVPQKTPQEELDRVRANLQKSERARQEESQRHMEAVDEIRRLKELRHQLDHNIGQMETTNEQQVNYHKISNISTPNHKTSMILVSSCSCLCPIHWSQLLSWGRRCSWSSADRRAPTISKCRWSTILLPTVGRLILEVWQYFNFFRLSKMYRTIF